MNVKNQKNQKIKMKTNGMEIGARYLAVTTTGEAKSK